MERETPLSEILGQMEIRVDMKIKSTTRIDAMLRMYPHLEDVFELHDVEVDDDVSVMSVKGVCREFGLDLDEIMGDLSAALSDSAGDGWLVGESDDDDEVDDDYDDDSEEEFDEEDEGTGAGDGYLDDMADDDDEWD